MGTARRALVLGGGGVTGIAWETGLLHGLAEAGVDLASADVVVGTSAGSVVGAQLLSGVALPDLFQEQLRDATSEVAAKMSLGALARYVVAFAWPGDEVAARARLGRSAIAARTVPEAERRAIIASRLPSQKWPQRRLLITAVDADTGEARVFDRESGVALADAVAASCAVPIVWPPVTIGGRRYMDGGIRSVTNADLATGCDRVVVLAPLDFGLRRSTRISHQLASLGAGVSSIVVKPDAQARKAIGSNTLDPAHRAASARAGYAQAATLVEQAGAIWSGIGASSLPA
ncbi:MAG TPA: patatin-like phospholipase family protein [Patescibacteria group bacterium]|nr:patatin-like phospholipase family protein [Patescibacteria group bacterium]